MLHKHVSIIAVSLQELVMIILAHQFQSCQLSHFQLVVTYFSSKVCCYLNVSL